MNYSTTSRDRPNFPGASTFSAHITEELQRYDEHLRDVRGLTAGTRKGLLRVIGLLLQGKFKRREIVFSRFRPDDVRQFLALRQTEHHSSSHASHHAKALRSDLRFRTMCGDQVGIGGRALWLGHESPATTHHYVEADLAMKERALARLHEPSAKILRYRAPDSLLNFLRTL